MQLGEGRKQGGRLEGAAEAFAECEALSAVLAFEALNELGLAYEANLQTKKALGIFAKSVELNPQFAEAHFNRGRMQRKYKKHQEALVSFAAAANLDPLNDENFLMLGHAHAELQEIDEAAKGAELFSPSSLTFFAALISFFQFCAIQPTRLHSR